MVTKIHGITDVIMFSPLRIGWLMRNLGGVMIHIFHHVQRTLYSYYFFVVQLLMVVLFFITICEATMHIKYADLLRLWPLYFLRTHGAVFGI